MTLTRRTLLSAFATLAVVREARAASPLEDLLERIARARAPIRTLRGPFTQTRTIGLLSTDVRSTGTMTLLRPDRLRWDLDPPDGVTFWVTPEGLAYRSEHGEGRVSLEKARVGRGLEDLRTLFGGDLARLSERWQMNVVHDDASGAEIEATPRTPDTGALRNLRMTLRPDLVRPARAVLVEGPRDRTVIEFGSLAVNETLDESRLRPPR
jgi:outer membrane lipoprotein-sorting protein